VALVDTSRCFHYGSRVPQSSPPRIVAVFQFALPSAFSVPSDPHKRGVLRNLATPEMSELERLVLGQK
jgi:hypothetical protein